MKAEKKDENPRAKAEKPNKPWFLRVCSASRLKTLEKGKIAPNEQFLSFSHSVFVSFGELVAVFIKIEIVV